MAQQLETTAGIPALSNNSDVFMALAVVGMLVVMVIPIPTLLLDVFLSFNITFSIVVLLVAMYTLKALEFSVFPSPKVFTNEKESLLANSSGFTPSMLGFSMRLRFKQLASSPSCNRS